MSTRNRARAAILWAYIVPVGLLVWAVVAFIQWGVGG